MTSNEKFCLRWNDFESNISGTFREIREEKDFLDCTLSCGSRQIQAHKLILSACSPFFRSILRQNPHQHPLLYLKGVEFTDLQAVLNFMYHGEVNVAQEELNSFLSVAEDLQVKGLTQNSSKAEPNQDSGKVLQAPRQQLDPGIPPTPKRTRPPPPPIQSSYQRQTVENVPTAVPLPAVKTEPHPAYVEELDIVEPMGMEVANTEDSYAEEDYDDYGTYEDQAYVAAEQVKGHTGGSSTSCSAETVFGDGTAQCNLCGKTFARKYECSRHVRTVHEEMAMPAAISCSVCEKMFKNAQSLKTHMRCVHSLYSTK